MARANTIASTTPAATAEASGWPAFNRMPHV